jgi:hypothetical protein
MESESQPLAKGVKGLRRVTGWVVNVRKARCAALASSAGSDRMGVAGEFGYQQFSIRPERFIQRQSVVRSTPSSSATFVLLP